MLESLRNSFTTHRIIWFREKENSVNQILGWYGRLVVYFGYFRISQTSKHFRSVVRLHSRNVMVTGSISVTKRHRCSLINCSRGNLNDDLNLI